MSDISMENKWREGFVFHGRSFECRSEPRQFILPWYRSSCALRSANETNYDSYNW
jgi:hypothetical protein